MSKKAYETGVVIIQCDGCESKHLIADHLGWFDTLKGEGGRKVEGTIEDIMRRKGESVVRLGYEEVLQKAHELEQAAGKMKAKGDVEAEEQVRVEAQAMMGAVDGLMEWLPKAADHAAFGGDIKK
jgi:ribosomal protein L35AE/L33A